MKTELSIQGFIIPLPKDFSMHFEIVSPVCSFDRIPYSGSIDFSLPINEITSSIFGHLDRFTKYRSGNDQRFPGFEVRHEGILLFSGTLIVNDTIGGNYSLTAIDDAGALSEQEQERTILEIEAFLGSEDWVNRDDYTPDNSNYSVFPIRNTKFFEDKGQKAKRVTNLADNPNSTPGEEYEVEVLAYLFEKTNNSQVNHIDPETNLIKENIGMIDLSVLTPQISCSYKDGKVGVISPFYYLNYVIKEALKSSFFYIVNNFLDSDVNLRKLVIYNNFDITHTDYIRDLEVTFIEEFNEIYWNGNILPSTYAAGQKITGFDRWYTNISAIKNHLPKMKVGDMLLSTQNLFNVIFDFKQNKKLDILSREALLAAEAIDINKYFLGKWVVGAKKKVALKFTRTNEDNDLAFSEGWKDLSDRRADFKPAVDVFTDLNGLVGTKEGDIRFARWENAFYEYKWLTSTEVDQQTKEEVTIDYLGWGKASIGWQVGWYEFGRTEMEEISSSWGPCGGYFSDTEIKQPGNMQGWKSAQQAFSPRLLIQDSGTQGGAFIEGVFSFEYEKENIGLLAKYWKLTCPWWANRLPVSGKMSVPTNVLRYLIFNKCKKYRTEEGSVMIDKFSFELYTNSFSELEVNAYKV